MAIIDEKIKTVIDEHGKLKTIISVLFAVLGFAKARGWFTKGSGPQ